MARRSVRALLLLFWIVFPTVFSSQEKEIEAYEDRDAYEVYVAALALNRPHQDSIQNAKLLLFEEEIEAWLSDRAEWSGIKLSRRARKEWQPVLEDYIRANQTPRRLIRGFSLETPYVVVPKGEIEACRGKDFWKAFRERFPGAEGYISFSSVGFNHDRSKAIVQVDHSCGPLCGGGLPHFLEKKDGKWVPAKVDATIQVWAS